MRVYQGRTAARCPLAPATPNPRVGRGQPRASLDQRSPQCNPRQAQGPASHHSQETQCTSDTRRSGEG